ncbi:MAG: VanZ family protein [Bacteroidota bacterium]|nr:VanZ family protein [Bacteroidota bacterium]
MISLSLIPNQTQLRYLKLLEWDKAVHCLLYFLFIIFWGLKFENKKNNLRVLLIVTIIFGLILEIFQEILPFGRVFEWGDFIANTAGALIGFFILHLNKKKLH